MGKAKPNSNNSQEAYEPVLFGPEYGEVALTWDFEADFAPEADVPAEGDYLSRNYSIRGRDPTYRGLICYIYSGFGVDISDYEAEEKIQRHFRENANATEVEILGMKRWK